MAQKCQSAERKKESHRERKKERERERKTEGVKERARERETERKRVGGRKRLHPSKSLGQSGCPPVLPYSSPLSLDSNSFTVGAAVLSAVTP